MRAFVAALSLWLVFAVATGSASARSYSARTLSDAHVGTSKSELVAQHRYSTRIVAQITAPKVHWKVAPRHSRCSSVPWSRICHRLRAKLRANRWLASLAERRLIALYPNKHLVPLTNDWVTAVNQVQRVFPGSAAWLLSCSNGEGGHGGWVWFGHLSYPKYGPDNTPGGWMQYMQGTFWTDYSQAVADARARRFVVPRGSASYTSATGQALAGGWAYWHARPIGKWTGGGC